MASNFFLLLSQRIGKIKESKESKEKERKKKRESTRKAQVVNSANFFGGAGFSTSIARRKTVVQPVSLARCCKPSLVEYWGETLGIFGYFAFWIAQNIALLALSQGTLTKAYTRNQHFWAFEGLSLGSQTSIPASKKLWIWHWSRIAGWQNMMDWSTLTIFARS